MLSLLVVVLLAAPAPHRRGFTTQLGLGVGATTHGQDGRRDVHLGVAPLSLGVGGFVNPRWAVMARVGGTNYTDGPDVRMSGFYGVVAQRWVSDTVFFAFGAGLGLFGIDDLKFYRGQNWSVFPDVETNVKAGASGSFRIGYALANWRHHSVQFSYELFPSVFTATPRIVVGQAFKLEWQFF